MIKGTTNKAKENARKLVDSMIDLTGYDDIQTKDWCMGLPSAFDSADFLYNGTPWNWLSRIYETNALEFENLIKRTPRAVAEDRCIWWAFKVLDNV